MRALLFAAGLTLCAALAGCDNHAAPAASGGASGGGGGGAPPVLPAWLSSAQITVSGETTRW